jgi:zinc protease
MDFGDPGIEGPEVSSIRSSGHQVIRSSIVTREVLDNGVVLLMTENRESPSVAVRASWRAGGAEEGPGQSGLASFAARMLRRGVAHPQAGSRSAEEISEAIESVGASFSIWAGSEEAALSAKCLGGDLELVLSLLQGCLEAPAFPQVEIHRTRGQVLTALREMEDSTRTKADLRAHALLYPPEHPYSRPSIGTRESVEAIDREALVAFHEVHCLPAGMLVSLAGDFQADAARRHVESWLRGRSGARAPEHPVTPSCMPTREPIPMPHKSQADLALALPALPRSHPDYYALNVANLILGSLGLMGRLGERVRDQQGLAYYVYSRLSARLWAGDWIANAGVDPDNIDRAIEGILVEMGRLREEPVSDHELEDAVSNLLGSLPLRLETNDGMAGFLLNVEYYGLGLDHLERYPGIIRSLTKEDLLAAARRYLDPKQAAIVIAGPVGDRT